MKNLVFFAVLAGTIPFSIANAKTPESCPTSPRSTGAIYTNSTNDREGEWLGMAAPGARGEVSGFREALAFEKHVGPSTFIEFGKCTYTLSQGVVDLRYKPQKENIKISLSSNAQWKKEESHFGIVYYICRAQDPSACQFTEID